MSGPACLVCTGDGVTDCQVGKHPEASLVYPGASNVNTELRGESNGQSWIEPVSPTPAYADIQFNSSDTTYKVIAWYDRWLKARGWEAAQTEGVGRYWQRGTNEQASIELLTYLKNVPYDFRYPLLSNRFEALGPPAAPIGDPVNVAAVTTRHVGIQDGFGLHEVAYNTRDAEDAAKSWATTDPAFAVIRLASTSGSEQNAPPRAAFSLQTFQAPEYYNEPERNDRQGHFVTSTQQVLSQEGFRQLSRTSTSLAGVPADYYVLARGDREVYEFAIGYGPVQTASYFRYANNPASGTLTAPYRVTTVSAVYAILPKLCNVNNPDCIALVPAPNSAVGP